MNQNPTSNSAWEEKLSWFKSSSQDRTFDTIDGEPMELEFNIFPGLTTLQFVQGVPKFMNEMGTITGTNHLQTLFGELKTMKRNVCQFHICVFMCKKISSRTLVILRTWIRKEVVFFSTHESKPQGKWDRVAELMMIRFGESGHPVFRVTSPLSRGTLKIKGGGKLSIHLR